MLYPCRRFMKTVKATLEQTTSETHEALPKPRTRTRRSHQYIYSQIKLEQVLHRPQFFSQAMKSSALPCCSSWEASAFMSSSHQAPTHTRTRPLHAFGPVGLSAEKYNRIEEQDRKKAPGKDLGRLGSRGFKS